MANVALTTPGFKAKKWDAKLAEDRAVPKDHIYLDRKRDDNATGDDIVAFFQQDEDKPCCEADELSDFCRGIVPGGLEAGLMAAVERVAAWVDERITIYQTRAMSREDYPTRQRNWHIPSSEANKIVSPAARTPYDEHGTPLSANALYHWFMHKVCFISYRSTCQMNSKCNPPTRPFALIIYLHLSSRMKSTRPYSSWTIQLTCICCRTRTSLQRAMSGD